MAFPPKLKDLLPPRPSGLGGGGGGNTPQPPVVPSLPPIPLPKIPNPADELASLNFRNIIGGPLRAVVEAQAQAAMTTVDFIKTVGFNSPQRQVAEKEAGAAEPAAGEDPGTMEPVYVSFKYPKEIAPYQPEVIGGLKKLTVTDHGAGYKEGDDIAVTLPAGVDGAMISAKFTGGKVVITIDDPGTGWEPGQTITLAPPKAPPAETTPRTATVRADVQAAREAKPAQYSTMVLQVPLLTLLPVPYIRIEEAELTFDVKLDQTEKVDFSASAGMGTGVGAGAGGALSAFTGSVNFSGSFSTKAEGKYSNDMHRTYTMNVRVKAVQAEMPAGLDRILNTLQSSILAQPLSAYKG